DPSAEVAAEQPGHHAEQAGDRHGGETDQQGGPGAVDHTREEVASEVVGPERVHAPGSVPRAGRFEPLADRLLDGIAWRGERRGNRWEKREQGEDEAEEGRSPAPEPAHESEPFAARRRGLRNGRGHHAHRKRIRGSRYV